mgnify:CR=1 FL=1
MFLRFSQILLIYFLLFSYVESAESGGMPQLNPEFWFSQVFWLIITFGIMFVLLSKFVLPKISENLEVRKAQILENIDAAEKQREESDKKLKADQESLKKAQGALRKTQRIVEVQTILLKEQAKTLKTIQRVTLREL